MGGFSDFFNMFFGYYFELSRTQSSQVPDYFIRKQTP